MFSITSSRMGELGLDILTIFFENEWWRKVKAQKFEEVGLDFKIFTKCSTKYEGCPKCEVMTLKKYCNIVDAMSQHIGCDVAT